MKIIHLSGYTESERAAFRDVVHSNIVMCIKALLSACEQFEYKLNKKNKVRFSRFVAFFRLRRFIFSNWESDRFCNICGFPNLCFSGPVSFCELSCALLAPKFDASVRLCRRKPKA